jgi:hypothetical protein
MPHHAHLELKTTCCGPNSLMRPAPKAFSYAASNRSRIPIEANVIAGKEPFPVDHSYGKFRNGRQAFLIIFCSSQIRAFKVCGRTPSPPIRR